MFSSVFAAQPLRFSLLPSALVCTAAAMLLAAGASAGHGGSLFALAVIVIVIATVYSLVGGYLLELSSRRAFLLDRSRLTQLALLHHNTEHLRRLVTLDPLTRLPNRRHFEAELERLSAACRAVGEPLGLLIFDIDHFKRFNDSYGHPAGDACLRRVGGALRQWATGVGPQGESGFVPIPARLGGEEFGVLLPGCEATSELAAAQRVRLTMSDLQIEHAHSPDGRFLTLSVGAASLRLRSPAENRLLLKAADAALYRAKGLGRDQAAA